jgi:hypothetical protein
LLAFFSSLNTKDREAFRLLAGIDLDAFFRLMDFSGLNGSWPDTHDSHQPGSLPPSSYGLFLPQSSTGSPAAAVPLNSRQSSTGSSMTTLLEVERLLVSWRSSRLRSIEYHPGSLSHAVAQAEAGRYLAGLLDTGYGSLVFNPGWAGERFAQDAQRDLNEAWAAIGRAVAIDLRREAVPWLSRKLGTTTIPSFSLEYTVRASPSNNYLALMTMRAVVTGISYGIPYQVAARALASSATVYFEDALVPLRYVEEPLPGLRIYVPRNEADSKKVIAELIADLSTVYPEALRVPSILLHIPAHSELSCAEICVALDGAYREAATGAMLARFFSALLHGRGYPQLASLIIHDTSFFEEVFGREGKLDSEADSQDSIKASYTEGSGS